MEAWFLLRCLGDGGGRRGTPDPSAHICKDVLQFSLRFAVIRGGGRLVVPLPVGPEAERVHRAYTVLRLVDVLNDLSCWRSSHRALLSWVRVRRLGCRQRVPG